MPSDVEVTDENFTFNLLYEEKKMKAFFNTKSIVRRVLIVSLLAGGLVFARRVCCEYICSYAN